MTISVSTKIKSAERAAFEIYLRTGRRILAEEPAGEVEVKFNPWHDPKNGQFTFSGQGNYASNDPGSQAFHGGGGSTGGGGAGGSWTPQARSPSSKPRPSGTPAKSKEAPTKTRLVKRTVSYAIASEDPKKRIRENGYEFDVDSLHRTQRSRGELQSGQSARRSKTLQRQAGGVDRRAGDDGGHYIAARFGGPSKAFNHFAQDANFNRGSYRALEDQWAKAQSKGHHVYVDITSAYHGTSQRPYQLTVVWYVDEDEHVAILPNERTKK